jgi:hypothetical protein
MMIDSFVWVNVCWACSILIHPTAFEIPTVSLPDGAWMEVW